MWDFTSQFWETDTWILVRGFGVSLVTFALDDSATLRVTQGNDLELPRVYLSSQLHPRELLWTLSSFVRSNHPNPDNYGLHHVLIQELFCYLVSLCSISASLQRSFSIKIGTKCKSSRWKQQNTHKWKKKTATKPGWAWWHRPSIPAEAGRLLRGQPGLCSESMAQLLTPPPQTQNFFPLLLWIRIQTTGLGSCSVFQPHCHPPPLKCASTSCSSNQPKLLAGMTDSSSLFKS